MKIEIKRGIVNPTIICGYKGLGLAGALVVNELIENLNFIEVGSSSLRKVPPILVLKGDKVFKPISVFHNKKNNLLVISILASLENLEWEVSDMIEHLYERTGASEVVIPDSISMDGKANVFYITNHKNKEIGRLAKRLDSSTITGLTSALLMKRRVPVTCFFGNIGPTNVKIKNLNDVPSNRAAANLINVLNKYLGINVSNDKLLKAGTETQKEIARVMDTIKEKQDKAITCQPVYIG